MVSTTQIREAFDALGLAEGSSLDLVKTTYKQVALRTHPDKNPNNPDATEEFQRVSAAYCLLVKHLDNSSDPSGFHASSAYSDFGYEYSDEELESDMFGHEYYDSDIEDHLAFYLSFFQRFMRGRGAPPPPPERNAHRNYSTQPVHETPAQYQERLRRSRQEQVEAEERRKRLSAARKERVAQEREQERLDAENRHKAKVQAKKAQADAVRKSSEARAREIRRAAQEARTFVFAAARNGEAEEVKKYIWDDAVDTAGGEVKPGCSDFVKSQPGDPLETLLHIATKFGNLDLVQWLDSHSAEPEERNSAGLTAFQLALKTGKLAIAKYFIDTYPPSIPEYQGIYQCKTSLIRLSLESRDPEHVWLILDHKLVIAQEIHEALIWASSDKGLQALRGEKPTPTTIEKAEDIVKLLMSYDTENHSATSHSSASNISLNQPPTSKKPESKPQASQGHHRGRAQGQGRGRGRGRGRGHDRGRGTYSAPSL